VLLSRGVDGADRPRAIRGPGAFVGLEALVRSTYADTARTSEPSVLCAISRDDLDRWFGPAGTPARMALEQTVQVAAEEPVRSAAIDGSAPQRVARWLLDEADHLPHVQRHVLASLLGMTPETLSRALARLRDDGAIELTRQLVAIRDRPRLQRLVL
jgi:CRP-like cAMP-binding protein